MNYTCGYSDSILSVHPLKITLNSDIRDRPVMRKGLATWFDIYLMQWNSYIFKHSLNDQILLRPLYCMLHISISADIYLSVYLLLCLSESQKGSVWMCPWGLEFSTTTDKHTNKLSGPVLEKDPLSQCESPAQSREVRKTSGQPPCGPPVQDVWAYHADRVPFSILSYCSVLSEHSWSCLWASEEWEVPLHRNENFNWIICS